MLYLIFSMYDFLSDSFVSNLILFNHFFLYLLSRETRVSLQCFSIQLAQRYSISDFFCIKDTFFNIFVIDICLTYKIQCWFPVDVLTALCQWSFFIFVYLFNFPGIHLLPVLSSCFAAIFDSWEGNAGISVLWRWIYR